MTSQENSESLFDAGCFVMQNGQLLRAVEIFEKLTRQDQVHAAGWSKLRVAYILLGRRFDAIQAFRSAIEADVAYVPAYNNLALALAEQENFEDALICAEKGLVLDPHYTPLYSAIACALKPLGRMEDAIEYLRQACRIQEDDPQILSNLGGLLLESGEKEEARDAYRRVLSLAPDDVNAHRTVAMMTKYDSLDHPHIRDMEALLLRSDLSKPDLVHLHFALGKAYEDIKDFKVSFGHYKVGNELKRFGFDYHIADDSDFFDHIRRVFAKKFIKSHQQDVFSQKTPIFIVGMPRSGTSLVEQILASHSEVYGAGELNTLDAIQFGDFGVARASYEEDLQRLSSNDFQRMAACYIEKIESLCGEEKFVSDKMPHNFRYVGLIKCLFPNAKIIHCTRDARDVGLSIYKNLFVGNLPFAYDLQEIGQYWNLYEDLMRHWDCLFPGYIYELNYENLVENPEGEVRQLLDFCDLLWSEDCLDFHKTKRFVTTASHLQVRQPIYKGAVGYWKNYAPYIGELLAELEKEGAS